MRVVFEVREYGAKICEYFEVCDCGTNICKLFSNCVSVGKGVKV